ncbi:hypothetical protein PMIT1312_02051 [Prochlorococcus marinus str. MIT 1312]|nr:hypothetical protein PMIT1312_02051 [Prochlorococcus marinus str. MIT 1312]
MPKPSKHQKQYQKRKKDSERDFRKTDLGDGRTGRRVTRRIMRQSVFRGS